jgi:hypothetical protein
MLLKDREDPRALVVLGMSFLVLGVLWPNIAPHMGNLSLNANHVIHGLLFGQSFAMNLTSIVITRRQRGCSGS